MQNKRNYFLGYLLRLGVSAGVGVGIIFTTDGVCSDKVDKNGTADYQPIISTAAPTSLSQQYPYANDRMVYICQEDGMIEQWSVDGSYQGQFNMPDSGDEFTAEQLLWVDNEEMIWYTYGEETEDENMYGEDQHVYAAPIEQKDTGEEPNFAETRELFTCSGSDQEFEGIDPEMTWLTGLGTVYADDRYLIYLSVEKILFAYDRISGGQPVEISPSDEYANIPDYAYLPSLITGDRIVYHTGREPGKIEEGLYGFWCCDLSSKELQNIDDRCFSKAAYVADQARDKIYYQIAEDQSIWEWDCQNGKRRELISEKQFRRCYDENSLVWDDAYYDDRLFVEEDRLYMIKDQKNPQIFSYLFAESVLRYEENLTLAVQNSGYSKTQEEDVGIEIIEGKLLLRYSMEEGEGTEESSFFSWIRELLFEDMEGEEEEYYICIDLKTAEGKAVRKKDAEKIYFGMLGLWLEPGTTGNWPPSNALQENKARSVANVPQETENRLSTTNAPQNKQPGAENQNPLSIENQLACISRYIERQIQEEEWNPDYHHFAVTDLDHNGRLELIATSGQQGSGGFTYTDYYQIAVDGQSLRKITDAAGEIDIMNGFGIHTVYVDTDTDDYYYLAGDYSSGGVGARYYWYGAVTLNSGMLTARTFACEGMDWNKKRDKEVWYGYSYLDGKEQKMKKKEFQVDQLADSFFQGMEKVPAKISWFQLPGKKKRTQQKILKKATASYQQFTPK